MATNTLFGCAYTRGALDVYARRFDILEVPLDKAPPIKTATLKKWRKDVGTRLDFAIIAPAALAQVRPSAALDAALEHVLAAQRVLQARHLLLVTPVEVTPAPLPRERLGKVVERLRAGLGEAKDLVSIAWGPRGVWEPEEAARLAKKLGVDLCLDPLSDPREPFWDPALRYVRVSTVGGRTDLPPSRLRALAELLAAAERDDANAGRPGGRVVVLTTPHAAREAKQLKALVERELERGPLRGGGMVISPRSRSLDDDEEE
jgi:uncharacterized protein YecE (DUF72 family)